MARRKYKLTGFARFFIVMLFLAPIAYLAASYINGEDGLEKIQNFFQTDNARSDERETTTVDTPQNTAGELSRSELERTIQELRDSLRAKNIEVHELRRQLRIQSGSSE